jgi:CheY-like chemotaxis protein
MDSLKGTTMMESLLSKLESDVRNELHSIMGMLELIDGGPLTESQRGHLRTCRTSADRMLRSVQNVYAFACPSAVAPHVQDIDLEETVSDVDCIMADLARRKGLDFKTRIQPGTATRISGDRRRIEDILLRLLENSIRFTDKGWVELTLSENVSDSSNPRVEFAICDSGPGIPEETIARVMSPLSTDHLDDGLGLPIVHQLVRAMGGELGISHPDSGGSKVVVSLPFKAVAVPVTPTRNAESRTSTPAPKSTRQLNILVAEDSDQSYYVIESYLEDEGHLLARAQNGAVAFDMFKRGIYDLVLMDIHMPVMDGYSATKAIRGWETTDGRARVPIVVLSSDSQETQRENGAKAGCSGYITKPASKAAVLNSLQRFAGVGIRQ